ncbi:MAG: hypothetical protein L0211_03990 [Planctomycetaceae bacterium]|nr:hypothetical protein [Planctomycetaceae bacterium]
MPLDTSRGVALFGTGRLARGREKSRGLAEKSRIARRRFSLTGDPEGGVDVLEQLPVYAQFALCNYYFAICNGLPFRLQIAKQEMQISNWFAWQAGSPPH